MNRRRRLSGRVLALCAGLLAGPVFAACTNKSFLDPITDIDWDCIFPMSIAGIPIDMGEHPPDDTDNEFYCYCSDRYLAGYGFPIQYWEPALIVDTVADAWCFPAIGADMSSDTDKNLSGSLNTSIGQGDANHAFQQYHIYDYPVWSILGMFLDDSCMESSAAFDIAMVSEIRPDWSDDFTAMAIYPETALMGNEAAVLACIADAVATTVQEPIDALYWCMGAWGLTYPMTGNITSKDYVEANAGIAARALYVNSRDLLLEDRAADKCESLYLPIWIKSHWRLQEVRPMVDDHCHVIGEPGLLWDWAKDPPGFSDNFSWVVFRKVDCCVSVF